MSIESLIFGLGFPLGTALLLLIVFGFSGIFSCCYEGDKLRRLSQSSDLEASTDATNPILMSVTVLMPGDEVPKFIAMPCPCQPLRPLNDDVVVDVEKWPKLSPHVVVPVD